MEVDARLVASAAIDTQTRSQHPARTGLLDSFTSRCVTVPATFQNGSAQSSGLTYTFLQFPAVTAGKLWEILRISCSGADPFTAVANAAVVFRSGAQFQDSANEPASFNDLLTTFAQLPSIYFPSSGRLPIVRASERILICIKGLAASTPLQATADVIEHDAASYFRYLMMH